MRTIQIYDTTLRDGTQGEGFSLSLFDKVQITSRLAEIGEVRFVNPKSPDEITSTVDILIAQKSRQFVKMGVANIFARPGHSEFFRSIAASNRPLVHVSRLDVGTTPAAANLGLTFRGCYYHLLASYDDGDVSRFGPGSAHMHELLRYAIERKCGVFDFTIGDERYKRDWCDTKLNLYDCVEAFSVRGACVAAPLMLVGSLKRWIKTTPALWSMVEKVRGAVGAARMRLRQTND